MICVHFYSTTFYSIFSWLHSFSVIRRRRLVDAINLTVKEIACGRNDIAARRFSICFFFLSLSWSTVGASIKIYFEFRIQWIRLSVNYRIVHFWRRKWFWLCLSSSSFSAAFAFVVTFFPCQIDCIAHKSNAIEKLFDLPLAEWTFNHRVKIKCFVNCYKFLINDSLRVVCVFFFSSGGTRTTCQFPVNR